MHLLDTNACIDFMNGRSPPLRVRMTQAAPGSLAMSAVTYGELTVRSRRSADPEGDLRKLRSLVHWVAIRPFDEAAGETYGRVARLIGLQRRSFDRLIAAHALAIDATLVTNNARDFAYIPRLRVENWTLPLEPLP